jgi:probable F420-dependent oxidoreductase
VPLEVRMKIAVEFPSVSYREGGTAVLRLARAIEEIGFDQLDMFDHVVMGYPTATRPAPVYPPKMPILEALMTLSYVAAATTRIGLGTEVLVLPQRQPALVAKQISTLDTLSGGRVRLGIGVGWQQVEFEALGEPFATRGARTDEAIALLRAYWRDERIDFDGEHFCAEAIAMEPKPPQGAHLPIWIGGGSERALRRVGELGDGWLASGIDDHGRARAAIDRIGFHAERAGRDAERIGLQSMLDVPPRNDSGKALYRDLDRVAQRAASLREMGFGWVTINATGIFQSGARSVDAMIDVLASVHDRLRAEVG